MSHCTHLSIEEREKSRVMLELGEGENRTKKYFKLKVIILMDFTYIDK